MRVTASTSMTDEVSTREADSLPYGAPLPTPKLAGGSIEEIPRSALRPRDSSLPLGMTESISNSEFRISNLKIIPNFEFEIISN